MRYVDVIRSSTYVWRIFANKTWFDMAFEDSYGTTEQFIKDFVAPPYTKSTRSELITNGYRMFFEY